ncbi:MAG: hypothetical protein KDA22_15160 [Phycisphaerales bacterium]|nr:hypothetical protein [Phycisphaerales bacterium]
MRRALSIPAAIALVASTAAIAWAAEEPLAAAASSGFEETAMVPANATVFVHIEHAASLRAEAAQRPIGAFLLGAVQGHEMRSAWDRLAIDLALPPDRLFDRLFGRSITLATRPATDEDAPAEWVLMTVVQQEDADLLLRRLAPRVLGNGWFGLTRQGVDVNWHEPVLLIAPSRNQSLAREVNGILGGAPDLGTRLSSLPEVAQARSLALEAPSEAPRIEAVIRHAAPMGGISALAAAVVGDRVVVRHAGRFENAPFRHSPMGAVMDISVLGRFVDTAVVATVEPVDPTGTRRDPMMAAILPEANRTAEERANLGSRRVVIVGEGEGRRAPRPFDMAYPTLAVAVEVRDAEAATRQQDRLVAACVASLSRRFLPDGKLPAAMPNLDTVPATEPRSIELAALAREAIGDHPLAETVGLHWRVVSGDNTSWQVFASDRVLLDEVSGDLRFGHQAPPQPGVWEMAGIANGPRIAAHLRSWAPHAGLFVPKEESKAFQATLDSLAGLAAGFGEVTWRVARPEERTVRTELELELAPPESELVIPRLARPLGQP